MTYNLLSFSVMNDLQLVKFFCGQALGCFLVKEEV